MKRMTKGHKDSLPPPPVRVGNYELAVIHNNILYLSGQLPSLNGNIVYPGSVGFNVSTTEACSAIEIAVKNALSIAENLIDNGLNGVDRCIKMVVYVAASSNISDIPLIADRASETLIYYLGESGRAARTAIGVRVLPLNAPVEVELVLALKGTNHDAT